MSHLANNGFDTLEEAVRSGDSLKERVPVRGAFHVHICDEDGTLQGDSGWVPNLITDIGFQKFLVWTLGASAGSLQIGSAALGTGAGPTAGLTALGSEVGGRTGVTLSTSNKTAQFTATFPTGWHTSTGAGYAISSIGLYNGTASSGSLFAGTTYTSSACASNQVVNVSYSITFA